MLVCVCVCVYVSFSLDNYIKLSYSVSFSLLIHHYFHHQHHRRRCVLKEMTDLIGKFFDATTAVVELKTRRTLLHTFPY